MPLYGYVWLCMVPHWSMCLHMTPYGFQWLYVSIWVPLNSYGSIWLLLAPWRLLATFGSLTTFGNLTRRNFWQLDATWHKLMQLDNTWNQLVEFGTTRTNKGFPHSAGFLFQLFGRGGNGPPLRGGTAADRGGNGAWCVRDIWQCKV